jgi:hypothetical protein
MLYHLLAILVVIIMEMDIHIPGHPCEYFCYVTVTVHTPERPCIRHGDMLRK